MTYKSFPAQDLSFKILAEYHCSTKFSLAAIVLILFVSSALHQTLTLSILWSLIMRYNFPIFLSVVHCLLALNSSRFLVSLCGIHLLLVTYIAI